MKTRKSRIILPVIILLAVLFGTLTVSAVLLSGAGGMTFDDLGEYKTGSVEMPLPLTYEASVRFPEDFNGAGGVIFGSYSDDKTASFNFEISEGGAPCISIIDGSGVKYSTVFDKVSVYNGERTHIAITLDRAAGAVSCYVNGELAETKTAAVPADFNLTSTFTLGADNLPDNSHYFKGELFGVALYSDMRSGSEIATDASGEIDTSELIVAYAPLSNTNEEKNIMATGDEKYNITYSCNWIKDVSDPENYAYSMAVIGDIQSMTYYYPDLLVKQFEWIRDNAAEKKIAFSVGLGDITEKNTEAEYQKVVEAYGKIDGVVPFSIIRGNHDRTSENSTAMYDKYINLDRYGDEVTGSFDDKMHATYRIMQIGKVKYLFMNLDFVLSDEMIDWANEVISSHPECHVIVSDHIYRNMSGTLLNLDNGKFGAENNPSVLWDRILSQHENIVMMLYGHSPKDTIHYKQREGIHGNKVTEMLINPSETDKNYGGTGLVAMLYFSEDGEQVDVRYYSTAKDAFFRADNQFTLALDTPGTVEFTNVIMNVGSDETERNLTWYTQYDTVGEVRYGKSSDGTLPANYSVAKATAVKASKPGCYSYKATMTGLEENSTYVYQLVVGDIASECFTFKVHGTGDDFSFAFITDAQLKESKHAGFWDDTLEKILNLFGDVSILVSAGDQTSDPASEENFDWFASEHLTELPISTTVGPPHDNTKLYTDHYNLPNLSSIYGVSTPSSDYFYTYNNVLFMHLNVENHDYDGHARFIESAIADNPDCLWRVVVLHYSFFSGGNHSTDGSVIACREALAGKFSELGIDVVLSGHDHVYSRSQMMADGYTVSGDVVSNGSVTNPEGTLYICGTSATGSGWYSIEHHNDDAYIALSEDSNRKSTVIFSVSEGSLTLKSYFIDGDVPEEFDRFTIYKTEKSVRLNNKTDMLEILDGGDRIPLVNAYAYSSATVKVVGGYWSLSTDGVSFESLGVASFDTLHVLRINESTGVWELSEDGGASFESLGINAHTYTVKFVSVPGAVFGDATDLSVFAARRYTAATPDAPTLYMPTGSLKVGCLYDWAWQYYLADGDGVPVSSFEYGESYIAYPVASETPVANTIYIASESAPEEYTYTWLEAWSIVHRLVGEKLTLVLKSDVTLTADDAVSIVIPIDLTLDLGGMRLDTSVLAPALKLAVGSNGSNFKVITSVSGGTLNAGLNDFIEIGSNQGSALTVQYGSEDSEELTVESVKYLVGANGNFKYTSTLNLSVYGGSYTIARGVIYVSNVTVSAGGSSPNVYKLTLKDADFNFFGGDSAIVRAKAVSYFANKASFISADGCSFTDTYKANHSSSRFLIREDVWLGTASFTDCDFIGMSIGADYSGAALSASGNITIGRGCTFTNSGKTFNSSNPISFFSEKVILASGCVIARTDAKGSVEILSPADAAEITWDNPVGYKEYWKLGATPIYLGESSFTIGDNTYTLVLSENPTAASASKTYSFKSAEGYLYKYNTATNVWQISTDGGNTYVNIGDTAVEPEVPDEPEVEVGCTVTVDGVTTTYPADSDFKEVIAAYAGSGYAGKTVYITLSKDMSVKTQASLSRNVTFKIDLAGNKLTYEADGRFKVGSGFTIHIYSSAPGGEYAVGGSGDGFQPGRGTIVFGSEEYKNNLTVSTVKEILNPSQTADKSKLRFEFLYCTVNIGTFNLIRVNAKGAGAITLEMEIKGCTINGTSSVISYNYTATLGATSNGGVCDVNSYINIEDTRFTCSSAEPAAFFGSSNFTDRYFGTVSIEGCTFNNYVLNGDLIRSDEALDYNTYYDSIAGSYDPDKAITVGKNCVFYNYGTTFTEDLESFLASNTSVANGCVMLHTSNSVEILDLAEHAISDWRSEDGQHWRECTTCADGVKFNLAPCSMDETVEPHVCTVCGATEGDPIIPPAEHSYEQTVTPPTCTERGYTTYTCTKCGDTYVDNYVTAKGHSFGDWAVITKPTCTEAGERAKECSGCGMLKTETIDALGHSEQMHEAKEPTCDEVGWNAYVDCSECNYTTYSEIPALGHDWRGATCTNSKTCTVCGATDGEALGHDWADATCNAPATCTVCGATDGEALGHDWIDATTEAPKTCDRCGATEGDKLPSEPGDEPGDEPSDEPGEDGGSDNPEAPTKGEHDDCTGNFLLAIWNAIVNFFRKLIGLPEVCICGKEI